MAEEEVFNRPIPGDKEVLLHMKGDWGGGGGGGVVVFHPGAPWMGQCYSEYPSQF